MVGSQRSKLLRKCCVAAQFKHYHAFPSRSVADARWTEGICFFTSGWDKIVNYPKQHSANCPTKHQDTSSWFKPSVAF
jgi:hypothetical protein